MLDTNYRFALVCPCNVAICGDSVACGGGGGCGRGRGVGIGRGQTSVAAC